MFITICVNISSQGVCQIEIEIFRSQKYFIDKSTFFKDLFLKSSRTQRYYLNVGQFSLDLNLMTFI